MTKTDPKVDALMERAFKTPEIIVLDIHTKKGLESYQIAQCFTGKVVLCFNQGGLAGCEKHETLKKVVKLK